jgi:hypothetical protein
MSHDDLPARTESAAPGVPPTRAELDARTQSPRHARDDCGGTTPAPSFPASGPASAPARGASPLTPPGAAQLPVTGPSAASPASPSGTGYRTPPGGWSRPPAEGGYPAWGGYSGWTLAAPAPSRRVHVGWLIAAVLITAVLIGSVAAGAGYLVGRRHAATAAAGPEKGTGGLTPPASGVGGCTPQLAATEPALTSLLVPVPHGASRDGSIPFAQALSLNQFVSDVYAASQDQAPVLSALCFQAAARQAYVTASGEIVVTYLIRFASDGDAESYTLRTTSADKTEKGITTSTAVAGVTDGTILCRPSLDQYGNTLCHVLAVRGNIAILMHVYQPGQLPAQSVVEALLREQFARL